jgi:hypothetical protein
MLQMAEDAARSLEVQLIGLDARSASELRKAPRQIPHDSTDGFRVSSDNLFVPNKATIGPRCCAGTAARDISLDELSR